MDDRAVEGERAGPRGAADLLTVEQTLQALRAIVKTGLDSTAETQRVARSAHHHLTRLRYGRASSA